MFLLSRKSGHCAGPSPILQALSAIADVVASAAMSVLDSDVPRRLAAYADRVHLAVVKAMLNRGRVVFGSWPRGVAGQLLKISLLRITSKKSSHRWNPRCMPALSPESR
jgi:hypothetical protein